ncbi:MFS transporter [Sphaerisporangium fuscum]|uniref:MFS transporter n=1 Tax=Sphaerisporangium fuscum TaxID=2835868 RepID=UPI001BDBD018|nr:MFS transporter [Sphaerisporangium fuscum]
MAAPTCPPLGSPRSPVPVRRPAVALLALAPFLANADGGIVSLAIPDIQRDLAMTLATAQWVTNIYVLVVGGLQVLGGRLADHLGARRLFLVSLAGFAATSAACGAAPTAGFLIAARATQAVAAALLVPAAMAALAGAASTPAQRARALATWVGVGGAGTVCGVVLGGLVVSDLGWRAAFYLNLPLVVAVWPVAWRSLSRRTRAGGSLAEIPGALALIGCLLVLTHALVRLPDSGWDLVTWAAFGLVVVQGALFAAVQARSPHPLLPRGLMRERGLISGCAGVFLVAAATGPVVFGSSLYLQGVHGLDARTCGFALLPALGGVVLAGRSHRRLLARLGPRAAYHLGCLLVGTGLVLLSGITPDASYVSGFLPGMALAGAGAPLIWMTCETAALAGTSPATAGSAAGVVQSAGNLGAAVGVVITVALCGAPPGDGAGLAQGVPHAFLIAAVLMAGATLVPFPRVSGETRSGSDGRLRRAGLSARRRPGRSGRCRPW